MTDVLCQSEIFCSLRHLRLDLGGHPDFLSASFFFWEACSWFHSCAVPVYLVSGWTAKEIFLKSEIQIPLSCKTFGIHSWESESWATPIWIDRGLGKQCNRHCQQTRVLYDDAVKMVSMARKLSLLCGSWPEILFHFCMGSRVNSRKCVYRLYLFRILECTCDTASTYNQAGAVCLWRHWRLGVKECHGTGWCWYVLARTSLLGGSSQQVQRLWDNLLHSFSQLWHKKDGRDILVGIPDTQLDWDDHWQQKLQLLMAVSANNRFCAEEERQSDMSCWRPRIANLSSPQCALNVPGRLTTPSKLAVNSVAWIEKDWRFKL